MVQKFLSHLGSQICLSVVEKGSDVVLKGAFTASLVVQEERLPVAEHHVA